MKKEEAKKIISILRKNKTCIRGTKDYFIWLDEAINIIQQNTNKKGIDNSSQETHKPLMYVTSTYIVRDDINKNFRKKK